jgi:hypothetical protein
MPGPNRSTDAEQGPKAKPRANASSAPTKPSGVRDVTDPLPDGTGFQILGAEAPTKRTFKAAEQAVLDLAAEHEGREWVMAHADLVLAQARALGLLDE